MPFVHVLTGEYGSYRIEAEEGEALLEVLRRGPAQPDAPCGGRGVCGKCRMEARGALSEPLQAEKDLLGEELSEGIRLACCCRVLGDVTVRLPDEGETKIETEGAEIPFEQDPMFRDLGIAVDIGTTTLAAALYDRGGLLARSAAPNPQSVYGADVITRIEKPMAGDREALASCIREGVDRLIEEAAKAAGAGPERIDAAVVTGNTTMLYLLTARSPECLSHAPFEADELFGFAVKGRDLGLKSVPEAEVYLPHCISAFVGADITTAILASGIMRRDEAALLADIGTNGELVLREGERLLCTSTAAGPVFEGAFLSCGMQGKPGAVDHVSFENGAFRLHVIGGGKAKGICGSGIIDAAAVFSQQELIEESGLIADEDEDEIVLTEGVSVTQKDIRMIQLAKSAVCAGMRTILGTAGLSAADIGTLYIAGGFGAFLDRHSAAVIGLYPPELEEKVKVIGNAALTGASMILRRKQFAEETSLYARNAEVVELSGNPVFRDHYVEGMMF